MKRKKNPRMRKSLRQAKPNIEERSFAPPGFFLVLWNPPKIVFISASEIGFNQIRIFSRIRKTGSPAFEAVAALFNVLNE